MKGKDTHREYYLKIWDSALSQILGWTPDKITAWAARWEDLMDYDSDTMFYHDDPVSYITRCVIPQSLLDRMSNKEALNLQGKIHFAIAKGEMVNQHEIDWQAAKKRVQSVLQQYGASLPATAPEVND